jgi:hypothetical protein
MYRALTEQWKQIQLDDLFGDNDICIPVVVVLPK